jgi:hypothetical protein
MYIYPSGLALPFHELPEKKAIHRCRSAPSGYIYTHSQCGSIKKTFDPRIIIYGAALVKIQLIKKCDGAKKGVYDV